jgi:hypothetical protein
MKEAASGRLFYIAGWKAGLGYLNLGPVTHATIALRVPDFIGVTRCNVCEGKAMAAPRSLGAEEISVPALNCKSQPS